MVANPSIQLGTDGNWAIKEDNLLAYKKDGTRFFNKEFDFTRNTTATFVDKNGLIKESNINTPRIDFTDDATGHLLLEPQSTNLFPYSEDFENSDWNKNAGTTITNNYAISPDGTQTAARYLGTGSSGLGDKFTLSATDYTISFWVKSNNGSNQFCRLIGDSSQVSSDILVTTEWNRISYTFTASGLSNKTNGIFRDSSNNDIDILIYGAQLEEKSYPTSYIPTYGSSATRNADICNNSGSAQDFNSEKGVLYAEIAALADDGTNRILGMSNGGDFNNSVLLRFSSALNKIQAQVRLGGVYQCSLNYDVTDPTEFNKIAFKYKQNDFALWVNGTERATDTSGNVIPGLDVLDFDISNTNEFYGKVREVQVFTEALTDEQLQKLTT